jgi:hypothetical protein
MSSDAQILAPAAPSDAAPGGAAGQRAAHRRTGRADGPVS